MTMDDGPFFQGAPRGKGFLGDILFRIPFYTGLKGKKQKLNHVEGDNGGFLDVWHIFLKHVPWATDGYFALCTKKEM